MKNIVTYAIFEDRSDELKSFLDGIHALEKKYEEMGVQVDIWPTAYESAYLSTLIVPKDKRERGLGTKFMEELAELADRCKVTLLTSPETTYGGTMYRLIEFYKSFGFVFNKGRNKDYRFMYKMYRKPN